jgi:ATP-dependent Clp protease ATP-binding subunit ClpC
MTRPPQVQDLEKDIEKIKTEKEGAIRAQDFEKAAALRDKEKQAKDKLEQTLSEWKQMRDEKEVVITADDMLEIVSKWTGVPLNRMSEKETQKLLRMEEELKKHIVGQDEACVAISKAMRRSRADLKDPKRPIGSFIFLGPTGVGKTMLAKTLAEFMFGDEAALIQIDMSEYMEKFNVSRLIGSPPGYVGYEEGGQLSEQVRRRPYSVVLFDEIEKAHPDVWHILLQIFEEGKITDSLGRKIDFRNTVIIMTSNLGASLIKKQTSLGFGAAATEYNYDSMKSKIMEEVKKTFKPEFVNRIDDLIVFRSLDKNDMTKIVELELDKVGSRLKGKDVVIHLTQKAKEFLIDKGYDQDYGARPLRRAIQKYLEDPIAEDFIRGVLKPKEPIEVDLDGDKLVFRQLQHADEGPGQGEAAGAA